MWDDYFHLAHHLDNDRHGRQEQLSDRGYFFLFGICIFTVLIATFVFKMIIQMEQEGETMRKKTITSANKSQLLLQ